jgi:peptidoglycan/xylan/chitin deacetylase (PgdA/CDA1 family)
MSRPRFRSRAALLALPVFLAIAAAPVRAAAAPAPPPPPAPPVAPLPEGPWPPQEVLAGNPAQIALPAAAAVSAASCPAAPYGVKRNAPGSGKTVALTFDDGPGKTTMSILSILQRAGTPATFFNLGANSAVRPAEVRSEATLALALGNHTWDHPQMPTLSASAQASEMDKATAEQAALVGRPPCLFRPPYGEYNATTLTLAQQRRMTVWNWSVDTEDWKAGTSTASSWVQRIVSLAEAGASQQHPVILMHNPPAGIPATVTALPTIIDFYRSRGYTFVDLLGSTGQGRPGPAAGVTAGGMHVFARAADGSLSERTRRDGSWTGWTALGGAMVGGPAAIPVTSTVSSAFVTGTDNGVWQKTVTDAGAASGWANLGGHATSKPGAAIGPDGVATVVVRGSDAAAWMRRETAGRWSNWQSLGGTLNTASAVAATAGGLTVAAVGADNALWVKNFAGTWSAWRRVGGRITADPAVAATPGGSVLTVSRGSDNAGWVNVAGANGTSWSGWQSIGGKLASAPAVTVDGSAGHVFAYGTDGRIWENIATDASTGSGWTGWQAMP